MNYKMVLPKKFKRTAEIVHCKNKLSDKMWLCYDDCTLEYLSELTIKKFSERKTLHLYGKKRGDAILTIRKNEI